MARRGRSGAQGGKQQRRISGEICTGGINHQPKSLGKLTYLCWKNLISETKESSPVLRERDEFRIGKAAQQAVAADRATRADRRLHRHLDGGPRLPMCPSFLFLFSRMMIKLNYSGKTLAEA